MIPIIFKVNLFTQNLILIIFSLYKQVSPLLTFILKKKKKLRKTTFNSNQRLYTIIPHKSGEAFQCCHIHISSGFFLILLHLWVRNICVMSCLLHILNFIRFAFAYCLSSLSRIAKCSRSYYIIIIITFHFIINQIHKTLLGCFMIAIFSTDSRVTKNFCRCEKEKVHFLLNLSVYLIVF